MTNHLRITPLTIGSHHFDFKKPYIMGIVNITPDSFYDGGQWLNPDNAFKQIERLISEGADIIDIGAESTRPNAKPVSKHEEEKRLLPILKKYKTYFDTPLSIDTTKSDIASMALSLGADIINDISAFRFDPLMPKVISQHNGTVILMHSIRTPETMQDAPSYHNIIQDVTINLTQAITIAKAESISNIIIDPGIGFGKTLHHNLTLLNQLSSFKPLGHPILVGISRKSMIGQLTGDAEKDRLNGTIGANVSACLNGANFFRVHDVKQVKQAVDVAFAIQAHQ